MFIVPLSQLPSLFPQVEGAGNVQGLSSGQGVPFVDMLKSAIQNMEETRAVAAQDSVKLAMGEVDDLHTLQINAQKAGLATDFAIGLTSRALSAYKEIANMQI